MATINVSPAQWAARMEQLANRFMPTVLRGMKAGAMRCIPVLQNRVDTAPPGSPHGGTGAVDTGAYRQAWKAEGIVDGARVFNDRPYSPVIDGGRRASPVGKIGRENIQRWAKRKLGLTDDEAKAASWAIAKTLAKRPLQARKVMSGALDQLEKLVMQEVQHELDVELDR